MAFPFAAFAGGFGQAFKQRRDQERLESRERLAEERAGQAQANTIFNQIQELAKMDQADEAMTLQQLKNAALDPQMRQQLMERRRKTHESARQSIESLANQPGITKQYGNVKGVLAPSILTGPGFADGKAFEPRPELPMADILNLASQYKKRAMEVGSASRPAVITEGRNFLRRFVPDDKFLDELLPDVGANLGFAATPSVTKPLQRGASGTFDEFFNQFPEFKPGVGGERILPTGAKQVVKYQGDTPIVEYYKSIKADYEPPLGVDLKNRMASEQLRQLADMYSVVKNGKMLDNEVKRWNAALGKAKALRYDKDQDARNAAAIAKNGPKVSDQLRLLSILMTAQQRQQDFGLKEQRFGLDVQKRIDSIRNQIQNDIDALDKQSNELLKSAGQSQDKGLIAAWGAAGSAYKNTQNKITTLRNQLAQLDAGNFAAANPALAPFQQQYSLDPAQLLANQQGQQGILQQMMLANMLRPQQPAPQPAPAQPAVVVANQGDNSGVAQVVASLLGMRGLGGPTRAGSAAGFGPNAGLPAGFLNIPQGGGIGGMNPYQLAMRVQQIKTQFPNLTDDDIKGFLQFEPDPTQLGKAAKVDMARLNAIRKPGPPRGGR